MAAINDLAREMAHQYPNVRHDEISTIIAEPGDRLLVTEREPFGGPLMVEIAGRTHPLGPQLAGSMRVRREASRE